MSEYSVRDVYCPQCGCLFELSFKVNVKIPLLESNDPDFIKVVDITARESDILSLIIEGYTYKAIANRLKISTRTVRYNVNSLKVKFNADSLPALTAMARGVF